MHDVARRCFLTAGAGLAAALVGQDVAALGEEEELLAALADRLADLDLRVDVALGRVDDVEARIERRVEQLGHRGLVGLLVADLGPAEAQHGDLHVGLAEAPFLERERRGPARTPEVLARGERGRRGGGS